MSATISLTEELIIARSRPKVMIADDDLEFLEGTEGYLSSCDFNVNTAQTPEETEQLLIENKEKGEDEFQVVAIDVHYGDLSETKGDDFARKHRHLLGKAKLVLFSGEINAKKRKELGDQGFHVLEKSRTLNKELVEIIQEENKKRASQIEKVIMNEAAPRIKEVTGLDIELQSSPLPKLAFDSLKQTLIKWLKSRSEPDKRVLAYGKRIYSANEIVKEVEAETEVGVKCVRMMLREFEHSLGIDEDASQQHDEG